jgi:1-acylglycerone phosphate reductase
MCQITSTFEMSTFSVLRVSKAVGPYMIAQKSWLIVDVSSVASCLHVSYLRSVTNSTHYLISATPWSGPYNPSKAAFSSLTDTLDMELRPFNVNVMLLIAGLVRTRIADNFAQKLGALPNNSPYVPFADKIRERLYVSQGITMDTTIFAPGVVKQALKKQPPRELLLGSNVMTVKLMELLPRWLKLTILWALCTTHTTLAQRMYKAHVFLRLEISCICELTVLQVGEASNHQVYIPL